MNEPITKVICKKPLREGDQKIYVDFKIGVEYDKFILETEDMSLDYYIPYIYKYIYIYDETGGLRFHLDKNSKDNPTFPNFYDFFYDQREIRKLKLEKIKKHIE